MSKKKNLIIFFSMGILVVILLMSNLGGKDPAAFQSDSNKKEDEDNLANLAENKYLKKELRVTVSVNPQEFDRLQKLTQDYEKGNPGLAIHLVNVPEKEAYAYYIKSSRLGEAADVMLLDNTWVNEFAALGYLSHRVDELYAGETHSMRLEQAMAQLKWNGYVWGVPKDIDPYMMAWNKEALKALQMQKPPETAAELIGFSELTAQNDDQGTPYGVYFDPTDPYAFISIVRSLGGQWLHLESGKVAVMEPATVSLMEQFFEPSGLDLDKSSSPYPLISERFPPVSDQWDPWNELKRGTILLMITRASLYIQHYDEEIGIASLPVRGHNLQNEGAWLKGRSYCISSKSSQIDEALNWIRHFSGSEVQLQLTEVGGGMPVHLSAYDFMNFKEIALSLEQGKVFPTELYLPQKLDILTKEMDALFHAAIGVQEFAKHIDEQWNSLAAR